MFLAGFLIVTFFRPGFHSLDVSLNVWVTSIQTAPLTFMAEGIALVFDTAALAIFSLAIATYLFMKNYRAESLLLLATMGADALIVAIVKGLVQSPRPLNGLIVATGFSFPSGHTAGSVAFCGSLAFFAWQHWKTTKARVSTGVGVAATTSVVGFSRVYLNVHWFSDVLGAAMLGVFLLSFAFLAFKLLKDAGEFESERFRRVSLPLFLVAVVAAVVVAVNSLGFA